MFLDEKAADLMPDPESPNGPYVPLEGGAIEATLLVKTYPTNTQSHGITVCTAAILDDGRLIRIYPVSWDEYTGKNAKKYTRISAEIIPNTEEAAKRPESHKLLGNIEIVNNDLNPAKNNWGNRNQLILQNVNQKGIEGLLENQEKHRASLGIVKVRELVDFHVDGDPDEIIKEADYREVKVQTLFGKATVGEGSKIDEIEHVFYYTWRCFGACCDEGAPHKMQCEDWELFEAFRKFKSLYSPEEFPFKFRQIFYDHMLGRNLHFVMGTTSRPAQQKSFTIIGLYYPPSEGDTPEGDKLTTAEARVFRKKNTSAKRLPRVSKGQQRLT